LIDLNAIASCNSANNKNNSNCSSSKKEKCQKSLGKQQRMYVVGWEQGKSEGGVA